MSPAPGVSGWRRLFSAADHPTRVIADGVVLRRYQRRRLVIAVVGGALGAVGVGFTFSHSGLIGVGLTAVVLVPLILGVALAALFVWVPVPLIGRWLAAVAVVVACLALMDMSLQWRIGLGLVGLVVSWVVAVVLQFGIGVVRITVRDFVTSLAVVAAVWLVVGHGAPASAQTESTSGEACPLTVEIDGNASTFTDGVADTFEIRIDGRADETLIPIVASSDVERGTVVVELIDVEPIPFVPDRPVVVWTGDLEPSAAGGGVTDTSVVRIFRPSGDGALMIEAGSHGADIGLVAGRGRYRATLTDALTGETCRLEGLIRIIAGPMQTVPGRVAVGTAVTGLGLAAGSILGGAVRPRSTDRSSAARTAQDPSTPPVPFSSRPKVTLEDQRSIGSAGDGATAYEVTLQVRIEEDDNNVYRVEAAELRWVDMIHVGVVGSFGGPGPWDVPIQLRTDPKRVTADVASIDLHLVQQAGASAATFPIGSLTLAAGSTRWRFEAIGDGPTEIDLRSADAGASR